MSGTQASISPTLRTWVEIDLAALRHNLGVVRKRIGPDTRILAVVKANAYGHGTEPVARALAHDVALFGVANLTEAREVLAAETGRDIVLLSPCLPAERAEAVAGGFIVTVSSAGEAAAFAAHGRVRVNFKIDTGMGRIGAWWESAVAEARDISLMPDVDLHSFSTHLPSSDEDADFTGKQLGKFSALVCRIRALAPLVKAHSLNSAGVFRFPNHAADIVRAGLVLYGSSPLPEFQPELMPVLTWKSRVTLVRDLPTGAGVSYGRTFLTTRPTRTAVLAVGYADGFPRQASGRGASVLLGGRRCPILGRVTMDQIVADITGAGTVSPGDEAVIIGRQGGEEIPAAELAARATTIAWDILTGIKGRVARIYLQHLQPASGR